jgi:NADPH:quinone reductase-like Zn-dependent oxidoreductase
MRSRMRAALVNAFDKAPSFGSFSPPTPGPSSVLIKVTASAVTSIVRVAASGGLPGVGTQRPFIPGMDGVGHLVDNPSSRVYFSFPVAPYGSLAETVAMPRSHFIPVPDELSDIEAAALANPAVSCWMALTRRAKLRQGETVLINGATGAAGRLAVQVAKHLKAGRIIATGRNKQRLEEAKALGADEVIVLDGSKEEMVGRFKAAVQGGVDVVLDYLWGASAEQLAAAFINAGSRTEHARRIRWVNIGSASGQVASLPAFAWRSSNLELLGSGLGSEPDSELMAAIAEAFSVARQAGFKVDTWTAPLEDVEKAWTAGQKDKRLVITM